MSNIRKSGMIITEVAIIIGSLILFFSMSGKSATSGPIGPDVYPKLLLSTIIILCVVDLFKAWKKSKQPQTEEVVEEAPEESADIHRKQVIYLSIILVSYLILFNFLGYVIGTFLLILICLMVLKVSGWLKKLCLSVGFVAISYYIFVELFGLVFPLGLLQYLFN